MHVWAEGRAHKVYLHNGILFCLLWRGKGVRAPRWAESALSMTADATRLVFGGIRPLGVVVDLAGDCELPACEPAVTAFLARLEGLALPAVLTSRRLAREPVLRRWCEDAAPGQATVLRTLSEAEAHLRAGVGGTRPRTPLAV